MSDLQKLSPFKYFVLTNFPFIEADFDALTNYELMCEVTKYINEIADRQNETIDAFNDLETDFTQLQSAWSAYQAVIDYKIAQFQNWFDNLDVQEEINNKLDQMVLDGTLAEIINPTIASATSSWLTEHITQPTNPVVDSSLTVSGAAADAKITGDLLFPLNRIMNSVLISEYSDWVQGGISSSTGEAAANNYNCRTDFIDINRFISADHVIGWRMRYFAYAEDYSFLGYRTASQNADSGFTYNSIIALFPTTAYVRFDCGYYVEGTQQRTTPDMIGENVIIRYAADEEEAASDRITVADIQRFADPEDNLFKSSFNIDIPNNGDPENIILTTIAKFTKTNESALDPTIYFSLGSGLNRSGYYTFGDPNNLKVQKFRIPRYPSDPSGVGIYVAIPEGVTMEISVFQNSYSDEKINESRIIFRGHRKMSMTPEDSLAGAIMGAKSGAKYFIEIPKRLSDGTWICYHDDTLVYDDTYIRQENGSILPSSYNGIAWSEISYETANSWDWGISKGELWKGTKPLTLDQFFELCSRSGMHPCLSIHPMPSAEELEEIKTLAAKYNVLGTLNIKCSQTYIQRCFGVFGNEVESYTIDVSSGSQTAATIQNAISSMNSLNITVDKIIELFASTAYNAYFGAAPYDAFKLITDAGIKASIAQQTGSYHPVVTSSASVIMWEQDINYWISRGVTEFTYEYHWNWGLEY